MPFVQYVIPLVSIFAIVVISMSAGWATPTESAAIGAFFTMLLAIAYRSLTARNLLAALRGTAAISGMILFIIVGATTFSQILSFSGASNGLVELIAGMGLSPMMVIACARPLLAPENDRIWEKVVAPTMMKRIIPEIAAVPRSALTRFCSVSAR